MYIYRFSSASTFALSFLFWQIDKTQFRNSLAGSTVTIHEHLDGTVSIRYGPHMVGRYSSTGEKLIRETTKERGGKGGSMEGGGLKAASLCFTKRTDHVNRTT